MYKRESGRERGRAVDATFWGLVQDLLDGRKEKSDAGNDREKRCHVSEKGEVEEGCYGASFGGGQSSFHSAREPASTRRVLTEGRGVFFDVNYVAGENF